MDNEEILCKGVDWFRVAQEWCPVTSSYAHSNGLSAFISLNGGKYVDQLSDCHTESVLPTCSV
jgi:hypothetical protein